MSTTTDTTGFTFNLEVDEEEDCRKMFQYITTPDGKEHWLDHTPYRRVTKADFELYVAFYQKHGRFPKRADIGSCGPLHSEDLEALRERGAM